MGYMLVYGWKWAMNSLSIRDRGGYLARLLPPVITDDDTKDQQVSEMNNEWALD